MQYACQKNDCDVIRKAWSDYEHKLNEMPFATGGFPAVDALHWRLEGYEILVGWSRQGRIDPKAVARKIEAIQWWQADVQKHEAQLAYWRPLLVMDSDGSLLLGRCRLGDHPCRPAQGRRGQVGAARDCGRCFVGRPPDRSFQNEKGLFTFEITIIGGRYLNASNHESAFLKHP